MRRAQIPVAAVLAALMVLAAPAWAWKPAVDTAGPLKVSIEEFGDVEVLGEPVVVSVTLENAGDVPVNGSIRLGVIDDWRVEGAADKGFSVTAKGKSECEFTVIPGPASFAAHYPVHAYATFELNGETLQAHAVYVTQVLKSGTAPTVEKPEGLGSLVALRAVEPVRIDGDLGDWTDAIPVPLGAGRRSLGEMPPGDFGAILYLLHDDATLFIGLRVTDDDISATDRGSNDFINSEYVRLYLSAIPPSSRRPDTLTEDDLVVAISPLADGGPLVKIPDYGSRTRQIPDLAAIRVVARATPTGYDTEIAVPLALIGDGITDESDLGFNLMLGDSDKGHREAEVTVGGQAGSYWTDPRSYATLTLSARTEDDGSVGLPVTPLASLGATALDRLGVYRVTVAREDKLRKVMPLGWTGNDSESGATFVPSRASRPDAKPCITIHPPYRNGVGRMWAEARLALPDAQPIKLTFFTAIRDNSATEPASDGVEWRVQVAGDGGEFTELFKRFSLSKRWEPAEVDLSAYAGKTVTLRLWNGPGPAGNTTCDSGYWGEPTIIAGDVPEPETAEAIQERRDRAITRARAALDGRRGKFFWLVENSAGRCGVGWAAGPYGFADGAIAFVTGDQQVVFDNFIMEIDGQSVRDWRSDLRVIGGKTVWTPDGQQITVRDFVQDREFQTFTVETTMYAEDGAFKLKFGMPTEERNKRGEPRFTKLGLGPATVKAKRVYAGFGNVIQWPEKFTLGQGGFTLSTRHVGMDFENGISLVQAADVFPYQFEVDPAQKLYSLQTGHDATLSFIPSTKGAFAAARVYRDASGFEPASGVEKLKGKMCIDWWGGHDIAAHIRRADAYGLNDSVFIKHAWQQNGYDYRLPDIYPPSCDPDVWNDWVSAAKEAGMLVAVHDNYIDFYPDASDFSYKHILFNADGTPQRAWFHTGLKAQSYRWRPGAYQPWLERNIKLIKEGFAPTSYFIDVFSAIPLLDYYDIDGNFHTKMECAEHWGNTFDYVREQLGDDAPQICEAGHDGLVGHLDGAQSDHSSAAAWGWQGADADRTPWHDMATHGSFVLLAGGLGPRYAGSDPHASWGSDDYLSNTVMGGRNPMCIGPCTRDTVMTYWLQHDICNELARQSLETHEFVGDDIHRQHTTFGDGGEAWVNRGDEPWEVQGRTLAKYGYLAVSGDVISEISERDGLRAGYARSPGVTFVDARPQALDVANRAPVKTRVLSAKHVGDGKIECEIEWEVLKPIPTEYVTFAHVCHDNAADQGEQIAIHARMDLPNETLQQVGVHRCSLRFTIGADNWEGEYRLRYGLYSSTSGGRLAPIALMDGSRVDGGAFIVTKQDGKIDAIEYQPPVSPEDDPMINTEGNMIDFGAVVTNGAFRLLHTGEEWTLLPLQGSFPFRAEIRLDELGAATRTVGSVTGLDQNGGEMSVETFRQDGDVLHLDLSADAFKYRIAVE